MPPQQARHQTGVIDGVDRYAEEQARIERWLRDVRAAARLDPELATELVRNQRLIKGYGDTFDRGLASFAVLTAAGVRLIDTADAATRIRALREAALRDDRGCALDEERVRQAAE